MEVADNFFPINGGGWAQFPLLFFFYSQNTSLQPEGKKDSKLPATSTEENFPITTFRVKRQSYRMKLNFTSRRHITTTVAD